MIGNMNWLLRKKMVKKIIEKHNKQKQLENLTQKIKYNTILLVSGSTKAQK